jgi:hypothetical protein
MSRKGGKKTRRPRQIPLICEDNAGDSKLPIQGTFFAYLKKKIGKGNQKKK